MTTSRLAGLKSSRPYGPSELSPPPPMDGGANTRGSMDSVRGGKKTPPTKHNSADAVDAGTGNGTLKRAMASLAADRKCRPDTGMKM